MCLIPVNSARRLPWIIADSLCFLSLYYLYQRLQNLFCYNTVSNDRYQKLLHYICSHVWINHVMGVGVWYTKMVLAYPVHPMKNRSRNKRWNLWVGQCVSSSWQDFGCVLFWCWLLCVSFTYSITCYSIIVVATFIGIHKYKNSPSQCMCQY